MDTLTPPVARRPRVSLWLLRTVLTVHLLLVLAQPVLAGLFLTGNVAAIGVHGAVGILIASFELVVIGVAAGYVLRGRGPVWVLPVAVALPVATGTQIHAGFARELALHIPLGVAVVSTSVLLAVWVWTPSAGRAR